MKPALLFIHGLGSSARAFDTLRAEPALAGYATHAPDLPGFGGRHSEATLTVPFETASLFLTDYANGITGPLAIIGHSMGGALGLKLASTIPDRATSYVSIEGNLIPEDCGLLSRKLAAVSDQEAVAMKDGLATFARTLALSWQMWADDIDPIDPLTFRNYAHDLVTGTDKGDWMDLFDALRCPKLYMHGDNYVDHPLLKRLPDRLVKHIQGAGHFTMQDQPALSAAIIADFVGQ